jgi:CheY-like chemotaxis protein
MEPKRKKESFHILLADDDKDDRFFFDKALKSLSIHTKLSTVEDGKKLMDYLLKHSDKLPDVLFLDLNMPRKNGSECLAEIKDNPKLKQLPVIIYSTSLHEDVADVLYGKGAHYYVRKTDLAELEKILFRVLTLLMEKNFVRPPKAEFIVNLIDV